MLIDENGNKKGLTDLKNAISVAEKLSMDVVQVSPPSASPVVCKIFNYKKHLFERKKNKSSSQTKTKKQMLKEIKFRPSTDIGDFEIKLKKIKSFILAGNKTKITVRFRGREILNSELGLDLLNKVSDKLSDISQIDQQPSLEGRQLLMILSPLKKK
jgi:translation initiation factor IF-3